MSDELSPFVDETVVGVTAVDLLLEIPPEITVTEEVEGTYLDSLGWDENYQQAH